MNNRENFISNASMEGHEWIPQEVHISSAYWYEAREGMEDICERYPVLFPDFKKGQRDFNEGKPLEEPLRKTDKWGCEWECELGGLEGLVRKGPLEDWDNFKNWTPPDPEPPTEEELTELKEQAAHGEVASYTTEHGFFFMRLYYLRGFENFMMDVAMEDERLDQLVEIVASHWERKFKPYIDAGVDLLAPADDLGTQTASVLGPRYFKRWLLPTYKRLFQPARDKGIQVQMHHDGYIMDIMDDIIESGVSIVNPQDLVNGVDNLEREVKGRVCINIDIDRQSVLPFGSPGDVTELVKEEIMKLGSAQGGLQMIVGIYPPTPLENVEALCDVLEKYRTYWIGR